MECRKALSGIIEVIKLIGKQGLAYRGKKESAYSLNNTSDWGLVFTAQIELEEEARSQFDQVFRTPKMFAFVMSRLLDEKIEGNSSLETENIYLELELPPKRLNQSMTNRFADHKNLYLDLSCFDPKRFSELKGLSSNALDKIRDLVPNADKGKLFEERESFVQDWPQISSRTEEYAKDADMESDSESQISEEIVQNVVSTCRMEDPCKGGHSGKPGTKTQEPAKQAMRSSCHDTVFGEQTMATTSQKVIRITKPI
ncbi:hypothetical protein PR048_018212 [Dryococelus australis]|uniref:Uncharacterized protein n=1 Tax=Dryococelus australis TaxID=614101 RepID=A0ABQ9HBT1_9NEOP|nr:hypothetical protein PR048_018212 [Dryococelus australis]